MVYQLRCPKCKKLILDADAGEALLELITCPYCKETISTEGAETQVSALDKAFAACAARSQKYENIDRLGGHDNA